MPRPRKPKTFADYPDVLTVDEAAELLNLNRKTVYAHINAGDIPALKLGRQLRVAKDELRAMLSRPINAREDEVA